MPETRAVSAARPPRFSLPRLVVELCCLRGNPQEFPYAPSWLALLFGTGVVLDVLTGYVLDDASDTFARSLLSSSIVLALCWAALAIRGLTNRYIQTAGALLACGAAFSLLQLPLGVLFEPSGDVGTIVPLAQVLLQFLVHWLAFGLFVWQIAVNAHVMRHAMDASFGFALTLVIMWLIAYLALERILFGAA